MEEKGIPNTIERSDRIAIEYLAKLHVADIALYLAELSLKEQIEDICALPPDVAAESLVELDLYHQIAIINTMPVEESVKLLSLMSPDDSKAILVELEQNLAYRILQLLPHEDAMAIRHLLPFDSATAGGIMNTEIVILNYDLTPTQAIEQMYKGMQEEKEIPYYAYIVNENKVLVGILSLRDILLMRTHQPLKNSLSEKPLVVVHLQTSIQEVWKQMQHYSFMTLPVLDEDSHIVGVVTYDDVKDFMIEEGHEMMLEMVGVRSDETIDTPWMVSVKERLPWLSINLLVSTFSAYIVSFFEASIAKLSLLAVLMPIVANQSGNTGQQALAVMLRQLSCETVDGKRAFFAILRECKIGLLTGVTIACAAGTGAYILFHERLLAIIFAVALLLDMLLGALAGVSIPLFFRYIGRDPAHASSIFLTLITDSMGFLIFLLLATLCIL